MTSTMRTRPRELKQTHCPDCDVRAHRVDSVTFLCYQCGMTWDWLDLHEPEPRQKEAGHAS